MTAQARPGDDRAHRRPNHELSQVGGHQPLRPGHMRRAHRNKDHPAPAQQPLQPPGPGTVAAGEQHIAQFGIGQQSAPRLALDPCHVALGPGFRQRGELRGGLRRIAHDCCQQVPLGCFVQAVELGKLGFGKPDGMQMRAHEFFVGDVERRRADDAGHHLVATFEKVLVVR